MVFGEKHSFAIEINLIQGTEKLFGQYCYWLNNQMIGDIEQLTLLSAIWGDLGKIVLYKDNRTIADVDAFSSNHIIDTLIYNLSEIGSSHFYIDNKLIDYVNINYFKTPCMDGYYIFLIENISFDWFLAKDLIDQHYYNYKIPKGIFYKHIKDAQAWISSSTLLTLKT